MSRHRPRTTKSEMREVPRRAGLANAVSFALLSIGLGVEKVCNVRHALTLAYRIVPFAVAVNCRRRASAGTEGIGDLAYSSVLLRHLARKHGLAPQHVLRK